MSADTPTEQTPRDRRSRSLTYTALTVVAAVHLVALWQASRLLPTQDDAWPIAGVVWGGIAAACCVAATILVFCRAYQTAITGSAGARA